METKIERRIRYEYGPGTHTYDGVFSGFYTWEQLINDIEDDRWGSPYRIISKEERTVTYSDWKAV